MIQTTKIREQSHEKIRGNRRSQDVKPVVFKPNQDLPMKKSNIRFDDVISLTEMKDLARRLPPDSKARELLFALNDNETRWIALGQLLLIHRFLWDEFKS